MLRFIGSVQPTVSKQENLRMHRMHVVGRLQQLIYNVKSKKWTVSSNVLDSLEIRSLQYIA